MEVKQSAVFHFSHSVEDVTYSFNIPAESREMAIAKLHYALGKLMAELGAISKAGTRAS